MFQKIPLLLLLGAAQVVAAPLRVHTNEGFDLRELNVDNGTPDVRVMPHELYAARGLKLEAPGSFFAPVAPLKPGAVYIVHGPLDQEYRVKLEAVGRDGVSVSLLPADAAAPAALQARYELKAYKLGDLALGTALPPLRLFADGSYKMGSATGHWERMDGALRLDGYYATWGLGDEQGGVLTFRFPRGGSWLEVQMERQPGEVAAAGSAAAASAPVASSGR